MIHQFIIPAVVANPVYGKCYVNGRCKVKLISAVFIDAHKIAKNEDIENKVDAGGDPIPGVLEKGGGGGSALDDGIFLIQSQSLFASLPNNRIITTAHSDNHFYGELHFEVHINGDIDLTILSQATSLPPTNDEFKGLVLTVDITPIA